MLLENVIAEAEADGSVDEEERAEIQRAADALAQVLVAFRERVRRRCRSHVAMGALTQALGFRSEQPDRDHASPQGTAQQYHTMRTAQGTHPDVTRRDQHNSVPEDHKTISQNDVDATECRC
eukprot:638748-Rhodomonas_salina.1